MLGLPRRIEMHRPKLTAGNGAFFKLRRKHRARRRGCAANTSGAVTQSEQPHTGGRRKLSALLGAHTQGCPQGNRSSPTLQERCPAAPPRRHRKRRARVSDHRSRAP